MGNARNLAKLAVDSNGAVDSSALANVPLSSIENSIATLALKQAINTNQAAYSLPNSFIDQFEDSTGIDSLTTAGRNASEYVSSVVAGQATGGTITTVGDYTYHQFLADGTFSAPSDATGIDYLLVGGGGSGESLHTNPGTSYGYGGQGGAVNLYTNRSVTAGSYPVVIGQGGAGWTVRNNGTATTAFGQTANGGIYHYWSGNSTPQTGSYISQFSQFGVSGYFGGAGHRGGDPGFATPPSPAAYGGGGRGGWYGYGNTSPSNAEAGIDGTGGGGGGGNSEYNASNAGGDGVLLVRYLTATTFLVINSSGEVVGVTQTANSTVSKMGIVIVYKDNAGTAALNTDLVARVSADGGSNYQTVTLASAGSFMTNYKLAVANNVTMTVPGTAPKYKINFANQGSGTKETQIYGVALLY